MHFAALWAACPGCGVASTVKITSAAAAATQERITVSKIIDFMVLPLNELGAKAIELGVGYRS